MKAESNLPRNFADILALMEALPSADENALEATRARDACLTKPAGSLGRLEVLAQWLSAWQAMSPPVLEAPVALVFAGNHGVTRKGVSAFPIEVTEQMVSNFASGGAAINQIASHHGMALQVVPLDLETPTQDLSTTAAMSESECVDAFVAGMSALPDRVDLLCVGEMGIGNTTAASALCAGLFGADGDDADVSRWVGPGTGVEGDALARKREVVAEAVALHGASARASALEGLRRLGGREFAAITGAVLQARLRHIPVVLDGFAATASAAVLSCLHEDGLAHCIAGHLSAEPAHRLLLERLGLKPLLDLGMRLGEASGAAVAVGLIRCAVALHTGMATFEEAAVSGKLAD
ncbi:MAG: nicotinate-nucleotide--dimethylbenzimidazole phosphoribosyltransferase [Hyphomicrobiales bacterium]|nr:nicotinate-nucleotide--dimethylbenzimidazole phosphoribosyltransferase [Hyphomicrobiales bacterium]